MRLARHACLAGVLALCWAAGPTPAPAADLAADRPAGRIEAVATFDGPMPAGVTVSHSGRVFVCFPKWGTRSNSPSPR